MRRQTRPWLSFLALIVASPAQELRGVYSLQGRIADVLGTGVPAAHVRAVDDGDRVVVAATSDGEGMYQLMRLPTGVELRVIVTAPGKAASTFAVPDGGAARPLSMVLEDGRDVVAMVRDDTGKAVAEATVFARAEANGLEGSLPAEVEAVTDAAGRCTLRGVSYRAPRWFVFAAGRSPIEVPAPELQATAIECAVGDESVGMRQVRVVGLESAQQRDARVLISLHDAKGLPLPSKWRSVALNAAGKAELPLLPFAVQVRASICGCATAPMAWLCRRGDADPLTVEIEPPVPLRAQVIRLQDAADKPVVGVGLVVRDRDGRLLARGVSRARGRVELMLPLAPGGRCTLGLATGAWCWQEWSGRLLPEGIHGCDFTITHDDQEEPVLTVAPAGRVTGTFALADGTAMAFAAVRIQGGQGKAVAVTDRNGRCEVGGLPPGEYALRVEDPRGSTGSANVALAEGPPIECPPLLFEPTGDVTGNVIDASGAPVPSVLIRFDGRATLSAVDGRFVVRGLSPGPKTGEAVGATGRGTVSLNVRPGVANVAAFVLP